MCPGPVLGMMSYNLRAMDNKLGLTKVVLWVTALSYESVSKYHSISYPEWHISSEGQTITLSPNLRSYFSIFAFSPNDSITPATSKAFGEEN
uniref:Uncharacterized protein n=1 Tax=Romanomermis culicivorax TaxID=13658 RepID=A0A915L470_ROMCU